MLESMIKADAEPSIELSTTVNYVGLMADVTVGDKLIVDQRESAHAH